MFVSCLLVNMVFINKSSLSIACALLFTNAQADLYTGLATRDQNPLLIPYWVPHTIAATGSSELQISSSLFISNTAQDETTPNETLIINAETYRLDINLQYEKNNWVYQMQIPFIASNGGFLDEIIIDWHDFLGLPQGSRLNQPNNTLNIQYQNNNEQIIDSQQSYDGIGDISFVAVRPLYQGKTSTWALGLGLNIPSGESNPLISNQGTDAALWLSYLPQTSPAFITVGIIKASNNGLFKNRLKSLVIFAQSGFEMAISHQTKLQFQLDYHSAFINSQTDALGESLQMQIGLHFAQLMSPNIRLFFSEDILVGSAPDITFGAQINWSL